MADLGHQLELIGEGVHRAHAHGDPVLITAVLALVLLIHRLELPAEARRQLPVEVLHDPPALGTAAQRHVAGVAQPGTWPLAVLHGEGVAAPQEAVLLVLHGNRPATVGILTVRLVDVADAELQLATGIAVEAADVEVVPIDVLVLEDVVLAGKRVAVLQPADLHVFDARAGCTLVPVVEIGDMDVVTFVEAPAGPERTAIQLRNLAPFGIGLHHPRPAMVAGELGRVVVLVVERRHAFQAQHRAVIEGHQVMPQIQLGVLFAFVTQTVLGRRPGQLKAGLRSAGARFTDPTAHVAAEFQRLRAKGYGKAGQRNGQAQMHRCFHIRSNQLLFLLLLLDRATLGSPSDPHARIEACRGSTRSAGGVCLAAWKSRNINNIRTKPAPVRRSPTTEPFSHCPVSPAQRAARRVIFAP